MSNNKKLPFRPSIFPLIKYLYPAIIVIIIIILGLVFSFLYKNVYRAIAQAEILTQLKQQVLEENLEKERFQQTIKNLAEKTKPTTNLVNPRDPFSFSLASTKATSTFATSTKP
ncbi:MAG: hypothetical protein WC518_00685 [Patescibacteria group bacterium]